MRTARAHGFTMIELLLSVALLALGLAVAFQTIRVATGSVTRSERMASHTDEVRTAQRFLRRQLSAARPIVFERDEFSAQPQVFSGSSQEVAFVAAMPGYLSRGGPHLQRLQLVPDGAGEGYRLEFDYRMLIAEQVVEPADPRPPTVLVDGIARAGFSYIDHDPEGMTPVWQTDWEYPGQLPAMLRLELEFLDERRQWPLFELPLPLAAAGPAYSDRPGAGQQLRER